MSITSHTAFLLALALAVSLPAQEQLTVSPKIARVEFENDRIRVLRVRYGPHENSGVHQHPARVVINLTPAYARATLRDGSSRELRSAAGTATWAEPVSHEIENLSDEPMENIEIELKQANAPAVAVPPAPASSTAPKEPMAASAEPHHHLKYENQYVRVLEVTLEPGESSFFHSHTNDVLYVTLANATARAQNQGEDWGPAMSFKTGQASFENASRTPLTHHLKNVGKTRFRTINIEFLP